MDEREPMPERIENGTSYVVVQVTAASADEAGRIARAVVDGGLAGSAQIAPVRTRYRWQGAIHDADEHLITMFTRRDRLDALAACVRAQHSYQVPQIVALPIVAGAASFLRWIDETTAPGAPDDSPDGSSRTP